MAGTIKLLSWNICNFGFKKMNTGFYDYVSEIIGMMNADIVGFIEIMSGQGDAIANSLKTILNTKLPSGSTAQWEAVVSDQFLGGGHYEQYIIFYKLNDNITSMDSFKLIGIINDNDFDDVYNDLGYTTNNEKQKFIRQLQTNKYLDGTFRVPEKAWGLLNNGASVKLNKITKDVSILKKIKKVLLNAKPYYLPGWDDRMPFNCNFTIKNGQPLSVFVHHSPRPGQDAFQGNNMLGLITELNISNDSVFMGDLNVAQKNLNNSVVYYHMNNRGKTKCLKDSLNNYYWTKVFQPITGPNAIKGISFYKYTKQLNKTPTSLVRGPLIVGATDKNKAYSCEYDNFFYKKNKLKNPVAQRVDVLSMLYGSKSFYGYIACDYAVQLYKNWLKNHPAFAKKNKLPIIVKKTKKLRDGFCLYRYPISDHVPVMLSLDYI